VVPSEINASDLIDVSSQVVQQCHKFVPPVPMGSGESDQLLGLGYHSASLGCSGHHDRPSPPQLKKPLVSQHSQGAQHGVGVHSEHGGQILGLRNAVSGACLPFGDGPADIGSDLLMEQRLLSAIDPLQMKV
jgi:hypothetical protein